MRPEEPVVARRGPTKTAALRMRWYGGESASAAGPARTPHVFLNVF